jgi:hypothetical protein
MRTEPQSIGSAVGCMNETAAIALATFSNQGFVEQRRWTEHAESGYFISTYKFCPKTYYFF